MQKDLKSITLTGLKELVAELGGKAYLAKYIFSFIHTKNASDINDITPLPKTFRERLISQEYFISDSNILNKFDDPDGTVKYLFDLPDGNRIEAVLLKDDNRKTVCISTQVGCALACRFCATGGLGFVRNLTAGEIVDQVYKIGLDAGKINNVVYMGMGEPMLNFKNVIDSVEILNHPDALNIGIRHITISTCGLPDEIVKLSDQPLQPRLAVSLHAADNGTRNNLMPINKKYPLEKLFKAISAYQLKTRNRITFEYVMIAGVNDTKQHSASLIKLLKHTKCNVNLIEFNPHSGSDFQPSSHNAINRFADDLKDAGIETVIRFKRGTSINAACGQLGADAYKSE